MIQKKLEELNQTWQQERSYRFFTIDGVLNYKNWETQTPKILFLLKESADGFIDIAGRGHNITKGNGPHFWWNICYWKYLINNISTKRNYEFVSKFELPEVKNNNYILDSISYVNIKKNNEGKTKSERNDILKYARQDKYFLKKQLDIIEPNVIFCSQDTFDAYKHIYDSVLIKINNNCFKHNERLIINFYHPSYGFMKGGREAIYNVLRDNLTFENNLMEQFNWYKNIN